MASLLEFPPVGGLGSDLGLFWLLLEDENGQVEAAIWEGLIEKLEGIEDEAYDTFYREMKRALEAPLSGVAYRKALSLADDAARKQAQTLVTRMAQAEISKVGKVIADGLTEGQHPFSIARRLDAVKGLDSGHAATHRKYVDYLEQLDISDERLAEKAEKHYQKMLRDRKKVIARTETAFAQGEGRRIEATQTNSTHKAWMTSSDDRVSDICAGNEAAGVIPIDEEFPSGVMQEPAHPRCRCNVNYVHSEAGVRVLAEESKEWQEETSKAREAVSPA